MRCSRSGCALRNIYEGALKNNEKCAASRCETE